MALLGHWKLQDNAASTTVVATVGTNGALSGAGNTSASSVANSYGSLQTRAIRLDGTNDLVALTDGNGAIAQNKSVITVCGFMKATAGGSGSKPLINISTGGGTRRLKFSLESTGFLVVSTRAADADSLQTKTTSAEYDDGNWHHVAAVVDYANDTIAIYVDGSVVTATGTIAFTGTATGNTASTYVAVGSDASTFFNGDLFDWRVYDSNESANLATIIAEKDVPPDTTPPTMSSATLGSNGTSLTLAFSESVVISSSAGYTLTPSGGAATLSYSSGSGTSSIVLTANRTIYNNETLTIAYSGGNTEDAAGNGLATISATAVTNNSTQIDPAGVIDSATANSDGTTLTVVFPTSKTITNANGWSITNSGGAIPVLSYVSGSGTTTIVFSASPRIGGGSVPLLQYDADTGNVSGLTDVVNKTITNNCVLPTPPVEYVVPAIASSLSSLLSGATRIDVADTAELTSLTTGGTVDGTTLAAAIALGPVVVVLATNTTFAGRFWWPALSSSNWCYVVPDTFDNLPPSGTRCTADDVANLAHVANIETSSVNYQHPAFNIASGASKYRFVGIEFVPWAGRVAEIDITLGCFQTGYNGALNTDPADQYSELPSDIILDRTYFHGRESADCPDRYAIVWGARGSAIVDSTIVNFSVGTNAVSNAESSVIFSYIGGEQYLLENCAISGAGENVIFGGTDSGLTNSNAQDVVIRGNHFFKEASWHVSHPSYDGYNRIIKNLLETKKVERILIEGNVFETVGENDGGQQATALVVTIRNQSGGDTDATVDDSEVRYNIFRDIGVVVRIANTDDLQTSEGVKRFWFHNNLAYNVGYLDVTGRYIWLSSASAVTIADRLRFTHNTFLKYNGTLNSFWQINHEGTDNGFDNTVIQDNVFEIGRISGTSDPGPTGAMDQWHVTWDVSNNVAFDAASASLPTGNYDGSSVDRSTTPDSDDINFVDWAGGNFRLHASCVYAAGNAKDATDGTDLGANISALNVATYGAVSGEWPSGNSYTSPGIGIGIGMGIGR